MMSIVVVAAAVTLTTLTTLPLTTSAAAPPGRIQHFIYLIQENRSFDHVLGWLKKLHPSIDGLTGAEYNLADASDDSSTKVYVHDDNPYRTLSPGHSIETITEQVFGSRTVPDPLPETAPMNGFVQQVWNPFNTDNALHVMGAHDRDRLPISHFLAEEYAVFDRWFCSVPGNTQPNRMYVHSATSDGMSHNDIIRLVRGLPQDPILKPIQDDGYTWSNYFQQVPSLALMQWPRRPANNNDFAAYKHYQYFKEDAMSGNLANVVFIDPRYTDGREGFNQNDDHPGGSDMVAGQALIKDIYETLRASPVWNSSMLFITYDEHGGFYDHVPTPLDVPSPDGKCNHDDTFCYTRLGVRVPTIVVSPWIARGTIVNRPPPEHRPTPTSEYEHSSVSATLKAMWNLTSDFLTERDRWAGTFHHIIGDTLRDDCPLLAPELPDPDPRYYTPDAPIDELQRDFVWMSAGVVGEEDQLSDEFLDSMTEIQADLYMKKQMTKWMGRCPYAGTPDSYPGCE